MNLKKELTDSFSRVEESRKEISSIKDWWETNHKEDEPFLLSGTPGKEVWKALNILDEVKAGKKILNIGIGLGYCTKELYEIGSIVHALDISPTALKRVEGFVEGTWLPGQLPNLPQNYFDLAISHLVAQHMSDADLIEQIKFVCNSLKPGGFLAIQIAYSLHKEYQFIESFDTQKWGGVHRSLDKINDIVQKAGGKIGWVDNIGDFLEFETGWYGLHITKNDSFSFNEYQTNRLNKKKSKLIGKQGDFFASVGKIDKANDLYLESLNFDKNSFYSLKKCGELSYKKDEKLKAVDFFIKARELNHNDIEVVLIIGQIYLELGEVLKAYNLFLEYMETHSTFVEPENYNSTPQIVDAFIAMGDVYYAAGLYKQSGKIYKLIENYQPLKIGVIQKIIDAESQNEKATEKIDTQSLKLRLAELAIEEASFDRAKFLLEDILSCDSQNISALIDLGVLNALENKHEESARYFKNVLEIDPENEIARENLAVIGV